MVESVVVPCDVANEIDGVFGALSISKVTACDPVVGEFALHVTPV